MFEKVRRLVPQKKIEKQELIQFVLNKVEHRWIKEENYIMAHMTDFMERLPMRVLTDLFIAKDTIFATSSGRYACAVSSLEQNVIIIFPEVYNLLTKTFDGWAKSVLAHEVGHIFLGHTKTMDDPMEAQVDADHFACDMGYLDQLESFLHEQTESIEKRVRLTFLSKYYFSNS